MGGLARASCALALVAVGGIRDSSERLGGERWVVTAADRGDPASSSRSTAAQRARQPRTMLWQPPARGPAWGGRSAARAAGADHAQRTLCRAQGRAAEAVEDYGRAIALAPDAPVPYLNRAIAREALGAEAEAAGDAARAQALWGAALADCDAAIDRDPKEFAGARRPTRVETRVTGKKWSISGLEFRSWCHSGSRRPPGRSAAEPRGLRTRSPASSSPTRRPVPPPTKGPPHPPLLRAAWFDRGNVCLRLADYSGALDAFATAADLAPGLAGYRLRHAQLLFQQGQSSEAARMLRGVVRKYGNYAGKGERAGWVGKCGAHAARGVGVVRRAVASAGAGSEPPQREPRRLPSLTCHLSACAALLCLLDLPARAAVPPACLAQRRAYLWRLWSGLLGTWRLPKSSWRRLSAWRTVGGTCAPCAPPRAGRPPCTMRWSGC